MLYADKVETENYDLITRKDVVNDYKSGADDPGKFFSLERMAKAM